MQVELWAVEKVVPYARNPRKNGDAVAKVAASIKEFGFRQPIVVDAEGVVIVGHTRLEAARQLGITQVPVHVATGLTPAQVKAYRIADNRTHEEAEWDKALLALEVEELDGLGYDAALTGFEHDELASLLGTVDPDDLDPGEGRYKEQYGVIVVCRDEAEQQTVYERLQTEGYTVKVVVT
ncbi:MAG: ParB N-terminal domain-containing protein [Gemmatimonadetes bacterium]|nr:ParB N-terminal domain-containing protein [Gemmatimonadota bacterium]